jgi:hypothetical protein
MSGIPLSLFHIFIVFPLLMYIAVFRGFVPLWVYQGVLCLGVVLLVYHLYRLVTKWKAHSVTVWINAVHVLFVAPLLIYIGKNAYDTPRWAFEILAMGAFATLGYNLYGLIMIVQGLSTNPTLSGPRAGQEFQGENNLRNDK